MFQHVVLDANVFIMGADLAPIRALSRHHHSVAPALSEVRDPRARAALTHLDEAEHLAVFCDEIQLAAPSAPVAREDAVAQREKVLGASLLAVPASLCAGACASARTSFARHHGVTTPRKVRRCTGVGPWARRAP